MRKFFLCLMIVAVSAHAQEYEARSEFTYCTLNEGMTLQDVIDQSKFYGEFSKKAGTQYLQVVLTPMHAGVNNSYDYVLWGQWPDGQSMYNEWGSYTNDFWAWMAATFHKFPDQSSFDQRIQDSEIEYLENSVASQRVLSENYVGLPY